MMCITKKYSKSLLLLLCCIFQASSVAHPLKVDCCGARVDFVDCVNSNVAEVPKPYLNDTGWCTNAGIKQGKGVTRLKLTTSNIRQLPKEVFMDYPNVQDIIMDNCNLSILSPDAFRNSGKPSPLKNLSLRNSLITDLDPKAFAGLTGLIELDLGMNQIERLPLGIFDSLENLIKLWLNGNRLTELDSSIFGSTLSLKTLYLSSNSFERLSAFPASFENLEELYIANNRIRKLDPYFLHNLRNLRLIDLSDNNLQRLDENFFMHSTKVYSIDLKNNQLDTLPKGTFQNLCELSWLDISNNRLTTPHFEWFANVAYLSISFPNKLHSVVSENPWECNCNSASYADFIAELCYDPEYKERRLMEHLNINCSTGKMIVEINEEKKTCNHNLLYCKDEVEKTKRNIPPCSTPLCRFLTETCHGNKPDTSTSTFVPITSPQIEAMLRPAFVFAGVITVVILFGLLAYFIRNKRRAERKRRRSVTTSRPGCVNNNARSNQLGPRIPGVGSSEPSSPSHFITTSDDNVVVYDEPPDSFSSYWTDDDSLDDQDASTRPKSIISVDRRSITNPKLLYNGSNIPRNSILVHIPTPINGYTPMRPLPQSFRHPTGNNAINQATSGDLADTSSRHPSNVYEYVSDTIYPCPPLPHTNAPKRQKAKGTNRRSQTEPLILSEHSGARNTATANFLKNLTKKWAQNQNGK